MDVMAGLSISSEQDTACSLSTSQGVEKLVEHYKDNDRVRVISVSIDTDVAAWKKMIAADKPAWEQYNIPNPDDSEGVKYYNITGIPRFMLFDREGKLYQSSASRPSEESTKTLIDSLLQ